MKFQTEGKIQPEAVVKKTVLIVDDEQINRALLTKILSDEFVTLEAENGLVALQMMTAKDHKIDLILLDVVMPVMDGLTLLKKIKADPFYSNMPVIITTSSLSKEFESECLEMGANDFVQKPYNPELIRQRVKNLLRFKDNASLIRLLQTDPLTGIYSRDFFYHKAYAIMKDNPNIPYDIVVSNIVDFRQINEMYGYEKGNAVLKAIANVNKEVFHDTFIVGRLTDDKFILLGPRFKNLNQRFFDFLVHSYKKEADIKNLCVHFAIYHVKKPGENIFLAVDRALSCLSENKNIYTNMYTIYSESISEKNKKTGKITFQMEDALANHEFHMYLQPKHDSNTGVLWGAEGLVRWIRNGKIISPAEFIPVFENNGFITRLDHFIWEEAAKQIKEWIDKGIPPISISVNISKVDFDSTLLDTLENIIEKYQIPIALLHLEITESSYNENANIVPMIKILRARGFIIEMDDFGSGTSSLSMLSILPIDCIKLDMRFVRADKGNAQARKGVISSIISLANWLNMPTIAEGVETKEEAESFRMMGCDYIQGYYYSKPLSKEDFQVYMKKVIDEEKEKGKTNKNTEPAVIQEKTDTILIIDDSSISRQILKKMLLSDYNILTAGNGQEGLDVLKDNADVSLILMDLMMPVMGGFTFINRLNADFPDNDIPVIAISESNQEAECKALSLGASYYISKPFLPEMVKIKVKKSLNYSKMLKSFKETEIKIRSLEKLAFTDELTGALSRRGLDHYLDLHDLQENTLVCMVDLNHLKICNDLFGHQVGDQFIISTGKALSALVYKDDALVRYGGDEFLLVLNNFKDSNALKKKLDKINKIFYSDKSLKDFNFSFSYGIVPVNKGRFELAIYQADKLMYIQKKNIDK